jgi:hypothetical protein
LEELLSGGGGGWSSSRSGGFRNQDKFAVLEAFLNFGERDILAIEDIDGLDSTVNYLGDSITGLDGRCMPTSVEAGVVVAVDLGDGESRSTQENGADVLHGGEVDS